MYQIVAQRPDGRELFLGSADKAEDARQLYHDLAERYSALQIQDAIGSAIDIDELNKRALAEKSSAL